MAIRYDLPSYTKLDDLVMAGKAQLIATPTVDTATDPLVVRPPAGQVAIITKIVGTSLANADTSPGLSDDDADGNALILYDEDGALTSEGIIFKRFRRPNLLFENAATPSWRSSVPCVPIVWEPELPLIVPPKHSLRANMNSTLAGGCFACYGYIVDVDTTRHLGFSVQTQSDTVSSPGVAITPNKQGFRGTILSAANTNIELVNGFAGFCIQIVDIYVRVQPVDHVPTDKIKLFWGDTILDSTGANDIMSWSNNNPSDLLDVKFSPKIYLPSGKGLFAAGVDDALGATNTSASVSLTYRYVPADEVPQDHWWSYRRLPTPGTATLGTTSLYTTATGTFTAFFPNRISGSTVGTTTATTPGLGKQFVVEGYAISASKDATVASDRVWMAITTGTTGGSVGVATSGITTTNRLISPILALGSHDQTLFLAVDGLNIPCPKDTGSVFIDTTASGATATPAAADLDVDESHFLVWGRSIPAKFGTAHFQGSSS